MNKLPIAQHYDFRQEQTHEQRKENAVYQLKQLNNLLKRALINETFNKFSNVLTITVADLCGGKGGDIKKWAFYCVKNGKKLRYLLADVSQVEVDRAKRRFEELDTQEKACFEMAEFVCVDVCNFDAGSQLMSAFASQCQIVSCQFAIHYAYETEAKSIAFWKVVNFLSADDCFFIVSHPSRQRVIEWCRAHQQCTNLTARLDNDVCGICFADPRLEHLLRNSTLKEALSQAPQFGACYRFTLRDALSQVPEFLMPSNKVLHKQTLDIADYKCLIQTTVDKILTNGVLISTEAQEAVEEAKKLQISTAQYEVACLYQYCIYAKVFKNVT